MGTPIKRGTPLSGDTDIGLGGSSWSSAESDPPQAISEELLPVDTEEGASGTAPGLGESTPPAGAQEASAGEVSEQAPTLLFDRDPPHEQPAASEPPMPPAEPAPSAEAPLHLDGDLDHRLVHLDNSEGSPEEPAEPAMDPRFAPPAEEPAPALVLERRDWQEVATPTPALAPPPLASGSPASVWHAYPSRLLEHFLETEGAAVVYLLLVLVALGGIAAARAGSPSVRAAMARQEGDEVLVTVRTTPADAAVFLDGVFVPVDGDATFLWLEPSGRRHTLRVGAPGHHGKRFAITPGVSEVVKVKLEPR